MRFRKILRAAVLLFTATFTVVSCITVDKSLGSDNIPEDHVLTVKTATFDIPVGLKMADSIQSVSSSYHIIGAVNTEEFGLTTFGTAANICPYYSGLRFGENPVVKEIYLVLTRSQEQHFANNQEGIVQDVYVHKLRKSIDSTTLYNNSLTDRDYDQTPLNIGTSSIYSSDSLIIYLNNSLGEEILTATNDELDTLSNFMKKFKGLYLTCANPPLGLIGGRLNQYAFGNISLYMKYNFKPTWDTSLPRKDTLIGLYFGYDYCLNTSTYSSQQFATSNELQSMPVEGVGGIKPYIDMISFKDTLDTWAAKMGYDKSKILISRAVLTLPFEMPSNLDLLNYYPTYLFPSHRVTDTDSLTKYYYPFDEINETGNAKGVMNRSLFNYSGDISETLQYIINNDKSKITDSYNMYLMPISESTSSTTGATVYSIDYINYYIGKINGSLSDNPPKLTLVYSVYQ